MKKVLAWILSFLLLAGTALADTAITVSGTGETLISADEAVISLGVSAREKEVLQAQQKVNEAIASVRAALMEKGVREEDINTDYINIYALYDYSTDMEQIAGYNANSTLAIRVTNLDSAGTLIDAAFAAGANTLNGISFSASDTEEAKAESMRKAVAAARASAEILAEASGIKIKGINSISEAGTWSADRSVGSFSAKGMGMEEVIQDTGTVVQAAKLTVTATVTITFEAE